MSDHDITAKCTRQVTDLQDRLARVRAELREIQYTAAAQAMYAGENAQRARWASVEARIQALLEICGG